MSFFTKIHNWPVILCEGKSIKNYLCHKNSFYLEKSNNALYDKCETWTILNKDVLCQEANSAFFFKRVVN